MIKTRSPISPNLKGYLLAFTATLGMSNVYVFSKAALQEMDVIPFWIYWFGLGLLWSLIYMFISGKIKKLRGIDRKSKFLLILIGFLEIVAASTLFLALETVDNPAVVSFLHNLTPLFVTLLGITFLKERFNFVEAIGIVLTLTGAVIISYTGQKSIKEILVDGTGYMILSSLFLSVSIIVAKYRIGRIDPSILMINRIVYMLFFAILLTLFLDKPLTISSRALFNIAMGSLLGPFMTGLAQYSALKYIEASRTMIIQSTRGMFVVVGAIIYLNILPLPMQIVGGSITIAGVVIITLGKRIMKKRS